MWADVLHLWLEREWIPISNVAAGCLNPVHILLSIGAVATETFLVTKSSCGEALTVHLQTLRLGAFAN